jgi:chloramphenicol O-acetyltransferase type A
MKEIIFREPHRRKHFEFFNQMNHPHFNICANVDITDLLKTIKAKNYSFTPTIVYIVSKTANSIPQFRRRIRGEKIVEHEVVHPSFTVWTEVADVFSFCEVEYQKTFQIFHRDALLRMEAMKTDPDFEDEPGRDDYLFLSSIPWVSFTSFQHAMSYHPSDSVPRITWGKYFEENGRIKMPLSVQAHHGVVDGRHVGTYFQQFEEISKSIY